MQTKQLTWSDASGYTRIDIIDPESTKVAAIAEAGRKIIEAHAAFGVINRERTAAQGDPARLEAEAKAAARRAGIEGTAVEPKKLRKKIRDAEEHLAEVDLEWEAASGKLRALRPAYLAAIQHHASALAAEAKADAEAGILSLATASRMARKADASMSGALAILGGLEAVLDRGDTFAPKAPKASRHEFGTAGVPGVHIGVGVENLGTAIGLASTILDDMKAAEKQRKLLARIDAETEAAPDLDDEDDDEEGDDD